MVGRRPQYVDCNSGDRGIPRESAKISQRCRPGQNGSIVVAFYDTIINNRDDIYAVQTSR